MPTPGKRPGSLMAEAMRRRAGIAQDPSPAPLWQRAVDWWRSPSGDETAEAAKAVDQAIHDQVLPEQLQIREALEAQAKKKAMIDAMMLRSAE